MLQVFGRGTNSLAKASIVGVPLLLWGGLWAGLVFWRSSYGTGQGVDRIQPVPFSHQHHVGELGIDCRYCHTTPEKSSYAGLPPTKTCMNCHSQIWVGSNVLEPVRASYRENRSIQWTRVNNLPGFVYFDHSIHVHKGVGCTTCHGRIDEMPFTYQSPSLLMNWCLECHRQPEPILRQQKDVFNVRWQPPPDQDQRGPELRKKYHLRDTAYLTSCSVCHR